MAGSGRTLHSLAAVAKGDVLSFRRLSQHILSHSASMESAMVDSAAIGDMVKIKDVGE
jgi:hypothetical protein